MKIKNDWRQFALAPIGANIGANWRLRWRQLAPVGANIRRQSARFWRQLYRRQYLAPIKNKIAKIWRQLAPIGAKLAPNRAQELNWPFTHFSMYAKQPQFLYSCLTLFIINKVKQKLNKNKQNSYFTFFV